MNFLSPKRLSLAALFFFILVSSAFAQSLPATAVLISGDSKQATLFTNGLDKTISNTVILDVSALSSTDIRAKIQSSSKVVVIGKDAFEYYLRHQVNKPVLVVYVKRSTFYHLVKAYEHINLVEGKPTYSNNISVIYSDPDLRKQLSLISEHYPNKSAAIMLSQLNEFLKPVLQASADAENVTLSVLTVSSDFDINRALNTLPDNYALLAIPDPAIYNRHSLKNIIISTYRSNRPLFGYSENMVKAGSVASYYTDTNDLVRETVELLQIISNFKEPYREHAKYNKLSVNSAVARSLGLNSLKNTL